VLIRTRLTLLALGVLLAYSALIGFVLIDREKRFEARLSDEVLQSQRVGWERIFEQQRLDHAQVVTRALELPGLTDAVARADGNACARALQPLPSAFPLARLDVVLPDRRTLCSSRAGMAPVDEGLLTRLMLESPTQAGVVLSDEPRYHWLYGQRLDVARQRSANPAQVSTGPAFALLIVSSAMDASLATLRDTLQSEVALTHLRGRALLATDPDLFARLSPSLNWQAPDVLRKRLAGSTYLVASQPVVSPAGRTIGILASARDVTQIADREVGGTYLYVGGALMLVLLTAAGAFYYLRNALDPLGRAVSALEKLARGDTNVRLDAEGEQRNDEAGKIGQGIAALRGEMLNLQMLRDERNRARQQQERVIRDQLKALARNLDAGSREEILRELEAGLARASNKDVLSLSGRLAALESRAPNENDLTALAGMLGRMSGIIATQQGKLLKALKEVQAAAETRAKLAGLQQELQIARQMQAAILPREAPDHPGVDVASIMIPAKEIGGDFYDYFFLGPDRLALVIADVSGKGVPAAFFMAISRTLLKSYSAIFPTAAECIERLNNQLAADNEQTMFVTTFYGVLDLTSGLFTYVNAGHNPPVLRRREDKPEYLPLTKNVALAVMDGLPFTETTLQLHPGDTLVLYTDGVTEATDVDGNFYGEERLIRVLSRLVAMAPITAIPTEVVSDIRAFERGGAQADDITCVAVRLTGRARPQPIDSQGASA
jgi:sigma-B regulation protein RsbU (phosphoserine phosphatase)